MTKKEMEEFTRIVMKVVGDGFEAVVFPEFSKIDKRFEGIDKRFEKMEQNMEKMRKELLEAFRNGQQSLSNRFEEVEVDVKEIKRKVEKNAEKDFEQERRLDKIERIVKAN